MAGKRFFIAGLFLLLLMGCAEYESTGFIYPNTVTANGDGVNETWCITYVQEGLQDTLTSFTLKIYNAGNHEIYSTESNTLLTCWDDMPGNIEPGTYYFVVNYFLVNDATEKTFWGEFKIVK